MSVNEGGTREGYWTMEFVFQGNISVHFEERAAQIRETLRRQTERRL